jgi:predicted TIM-barrel fold metal-dependent hydrolase
MIIDSHQHAFWHGRDAAGLIADMNANGIDKAWLLSWECAPDEDNPAYHFAFNPENLRADGTHRGIPLSDLLRARDQFPGRFEIGYCPHPLLGDAPALLEAAVNMHGVRICGEWKCRMLLDDPRCINLFRKAGDLNCPVIFHLDVPYLTSPESGQPEYCPEWYGGTIGNLQRTLEACPKTRFIGHAPGFWRHISGDADEAPGMYPDGPVMGGGKVFELLEKYDNLYLDLSAGSALYALDRDHSVTVDLLTRFADKVLFARDYYSEMMRDTYGRDIQDLLGQLDLNEAIREKIFHRNAEHLLQSD